MLASERNKVAGEVQIIAHHVVGVIQAVPARSGLIEVRQDVSLQFVLEELLAHEQHGDAGRGHQQARRQA